MQFGITRSRLHVIAKPERIVINQAESQQQHVDGYDNSLANPF